MAKCCASQLKHRVTVQAVTRVADGQGGFSELWADVATVWAGVSPVKGYERFQTMQTATPITHDIMVRYTSAITTSSRLVFGTRVFGVKEVLNVNEDSRFLKIKALEVESREFAEDIGAILLRTGGFLSLRDGGKILLRA